MRIAVYADEVDPSCTYRAFEPMDALMRRGHGVWVNEPPETAEFDVVHISRFIGEQVQDVTRSLRRAGAGVVWDHDDAIHIAPHLKRGTLKAQRITAQIQRMVRLADVVTTTSPVLADAYRELGAESVRVIDNYLGSSFTDLQRPAHDGIVIGWAAWIDHQADWEALELRPVFERLLQAHPDLRVETIGHVNLGLRSERYTRIPTVAFEALGTQLTDLDIGIAPIADNAFNRARSNIKVKEYAAAGVPWLASPVGPYAGMGEQQGGRLVADDAWAQEIGQLIEKRRLRRKLAKRARRWAREQTLERNLEKWEDVLAEAVERAGSRRDGGRRLAGRP
jgi:glycosyltransferase involved in cell wall biosynthesis